MQRYCASSLQATRMAVRAIRSGEGHALIAAGVEMVSRYDLGKEAELSEQIRPRAAGKEPAGSATG